MLVALTPAAIATPLLISSMRFHHGLRTTTDFPGRLCIDHKCSRAAGIQSNDYSGDTKQPRHMRVMATGTGMHHVNPAAIGTALFRSCRIGQPGRHAHRIRNHMRAVPDCRALAILERTDDTGLANAIGDGKTRRRG